MGLTPLRREMAATRCSYDLNSSWPRNPCRSHLLRLEACFRCTGSTIVYEEDRGAGMERQTSRCRAQSMSAGWGCHRSRWASSRARSSGSAGVIIADVEVIVVGGALDSVYRHHAGIAGGTSVRLVNLRPQSWWMSWARRRVFVAILKEAPCSRTRSLKNTGAVIEACSLCNDQDTGRDGRNTVEQGWRAGR